MKGTELFLFIKSLLLNAVIHVDSEVGRSEVPRTSREAKEAPRRLKQVCVLM